MTSSSSQNGKGAASARLSGTSSSWCALSNDQSQYLQIDFGKVLTMTGIAVQGNPTADSWVKDFYFDYGMDLNSLVTYQENGTNKVSYWKQKNLLTLYRSEIKDSISGVVAGGNFLWGANEDEMRCKRFWVIFSV